MHRNEGTNVADSDLIIAWHPADQHGWPMSPVRRIGCRSRAHRVESGNRGRVMGADVSARHDHSGIHDKGVGARWIEKSNSSSARLPSGTSRARFMLGGSIFRFSSRRQHFDPTNGLSILALPLATPPLLWRREP